MHVVWYCEHVRTCARHMTLCTCPNMCTSRDIVNMSVHVQCYTNCHSSDALSNTGPYWVGEGQGGPPPPMLLKVLHNHYIFVSRLWLTHFFLDTRPVACLVKLVREKLGKYIQDFVSAANSQQHLQCRHQYLSKPRYNPIQPYQYVLCSYWHQMPCTGLHW